MDYGFDVAGHRSVADRKNVGLADFPARGGIRFTGKAGTHAQVRPNDPSVAQQGLGNALDQHVMCGQRRAVLRCGLGQASDACIGDPYGFVAGGIRDAGKKSGGEKLDLQNVLNGPACGSICFAQAARVMASNGTHRRRSASELVACHRAILFSKAVYIYSVS